MLQELAQLNSAHLAGCFVDRPGVIDHDRIIGAFPWNQLAAADKSYGVPGRILFQLAIEKQVAGQGQASVAGDKKGVELDQGLGVCELRE